jgi:hypothetical protein
LLIVALTLVAAGGAAYATIPGSDGVISGCRDVKTGALRVIDAEAGATCMAKESALNWNQTGPQGPQGEAGEAGPPGTAAAYARINADGTVNTDFAQGISSANVSHPATGIYCLRNLGFQPRAVVGTGPATIASDGAGGFIATGYDTNVTASLLLTAGAFFVFCDDASTPPAERASVRIYVAAPNGLVDRSFTVLLED